jgi:hypothetical protein
VPVEGVDEWRQQVLELLTTLSEPLQALLLVAAFSLGLFSVRAVVK